MQPHELSRRGFLSTAAAAAGAVVVGSYAEAALPGTPKIHPAYVYGEPDRLFGLRQTFEVPGHVTGHHTSNTHTLMAAFGEEDTIAGTEEPVDPKKILAEEADKSPQTGNSRVVKVRETENGKVDMSQYPDSIRFVGFSDAGLRGAEHPAYVRSIVYMAIDGLPDVYIRRFYRGDCVQLGYPLHLGAKRLADKQKLNLQPRNDRTAIDLRAKDYPDESPPYCAVRMENGPYDMLLKLSREAGGISLITGICSIPAVNENGEPEPLEAPIVMREFPDPPWPEAFKMKE